MKQYIITAFCILFAIAVNAQAPNNPIFTGGNGDGWTSHNYQQAENNIFAGGNGDGWSSSNYRQPESNIFTGGIGDGWSGGYAYIELSIADLEKAGIHIYPNPVSSFLNIDIVDSDLYHFTLYDNSGKQMISKIITGNDKIEMNVYSTGVYFVHLQKTDSKTVKVVKIIKK